MKIILIAANKGRKEKGGFEMCYLLDDLMNYEMRKDASFLNPYQGNTDIERMNVAHREAKRHARRTELTQDKAQADRIHSSLRDLKAAADMTRRKKLASPKESILARKYEQQGLTEEEAKLKAFRQHRLRKRLLLGAGAAAAVGAGVGAYKYHDYVTDKTIPKGKILQHIRVGDDTHFDDGPFFSSHRSSDNQSYRGMYGKQIEKGNVASIPVNKSELEATQDIKIPSHKKTKQEFQALLKENPDSIQALRDGIDSVAQAARVDDPIPFSKRNRMYARAKKNLTKGKIDGTVYDAASSNFTKRQRDRNPEFAEKIEKELYNRLKTKGYHGIADRNDQKYSGYNTKSSNILFAANDKIKIKSDEPLEKKQINKDLAKVIVKKTGQISAKGGAIIGAAGAGLGLLKESVKEKDQDQKVKAYRRTHPESKLSYHEILAL